MWAGEVILSKNLRTSKQYLRVWMLTMFIPGLNMLQQNVKTTTLLIFPYSAQTRTVVKTRVRKDSHVNTRSVPGSSRTTYKQL